MRTHFFRISAGCLLSSVCVSCSCFSRPAMDPGRIQTLKEMPQEQRRVFLKGFAGDWRTDTDKSRNVPPPPVEKPYPAEAVLVDLVAPENLSLGRTPLAQVIRQRRSRRSYTRDAVSREELSFLLWSTQGLSTLEKAPDGQVVNQLRTVPSGGARHPFETYLAVNRVEGLAPGLYRYLPVEHKLLTIRREDGLEATLNRLCYGQKNAGESAVLFIWTAIPRRTEWAYGYLAEKLIAVDAGHVGQNLYLAAESVGAGACAMLGYDQAGMDKFLGVDGTDEFTIYTASVGKIDSSSAETRP